MQEQSTRQPQGFEFRGSAGEWFGIWIVNLVLTILTIGIYSAWAKVRTKKYFYQNTYVADRNFDYHATGMQIFIGRIIMVVGFVIFSLVSAIPIVGLVALIGLFFAIPWLLVRALRFNAQMSSWSNVRFRFGGGYGGALLAYIVYPFLCALTLYLTVPFLDRAVKRYTMNNHSLGKHEFSFDAPIGGFYKAFLVAILWVVGVTLVTAALVIPGFSQFRIDEVLEGNDPAVVGPLVAAIYIWFFVALIPAGVIYSAMVRNITFSNLELEGGHTFHSNVSPGRLIWITFSNAIVTVLTLGLMLPWAQVRMTRYLADHTTLIPGPSMDNFLSQMDAEATSLGDAYTDIEGFDVGLPV